MTYISNFASVSLAVLMFLLLAIHQIKYDAKKGVYKKKPLKDLLFPPVLPIHLSPPVIPMRPMKTSQSLPIMYL